MINNPKIWNINKSWTLFLDRDGVINQKIDGYVRLWKDFNYVSGVLDNVANMMQLFGKIIVVTNQQGIGKQLMTHEELQQIFTDLQADFVQVGGKIDGFYYCPHLNYAGCDCRKPRIGMGLQAKNEHPSINFRQSIMVGDSLTDMEFGRKLGMKTVFVTNGERFKAKKHRFTDIYYNNLGEFIQALL